jgi:hypothetical protein
LPSSRRKPPRPPSPPLRPPPTSASALSVDPLATRLVNITSNKQKGITDIFKVTKAKAKAKAKAPVARTTKLRYFLTTKQLSEVIESHDENNLSHEWVKGDFSFAAKGEVIPTGTLEMLIKLPSGLDFPVFPRILKLEGGVEEQEKKQQEAEEEEEEEEEEHESDSELSECGYVSDIHN